MGRSGARARLKVLLEAYSGKEIGADPLPSKLVKSACTRKWCRTQPQPWVARVCVCVLTALGLARARVVGGVRVESGAVHARCQATGLLARERLRTALWC